MTSPTDSTDSTDPSDPSDLTDPSDPSDLTDPSDPSDPTDPHAHREARADRTRRTTAAPSPWWTVAAAGAGVVGCALTGAIVGVVSDPPPVLQRIGVSESGLLGVALLAVVVLVGLLSMFALCAGLVWMILDGVPRLVRRRADARDEPGAHGRGRVVLGVLAAGAVSMLLAIAAWWPVAVGADLHGVVLVWSGLIACCLGTVAVIAPILAFAASAVWKKDADRDANRKAAAAVG